MKNLLIDVSRWNTDVDFNAWKEKRGLWGAIIKTGGNDDGRYQDRLFETHYANAKAAGLHIGFYYYSTATDTATAIADAKHMMQIVGDKSFDMPWYIDVEDSNQFALSCRDLTDVIKAFCDYLNEQGIYSGVYIGGSAWLNNVYHTELSDYANWIAWWRESWPSEAGDIGMWQQGGMRLSDGDICFEDQPGHLDCDWCVIDYPSRIASGWLNSIKNTSNQNGSTSSSGNSGAASAYDIVQAAYAEVGNVSGKKYWDWYFGGTWEYVDGWNTPYCACFCSYILGVNGVRSPCFPSACAFDERDDFDGRYVSKYDLQPGDVVAFDWDYDARGDHVGIVVGTFDGGVYTVEGNTNGGVVAECTRYYSQIICGVRPYYEGVEDSSTDLAIDGWAGPKTISKWQDALGTGTDGYLSDQSHEHDAYRGHVVSVSYGSEGTGSNLVRRVQKIIGAKVDGMWGKETSTKLQQYLINNGFSCGEAGADGDFGKYSVMALQKSLNAGFWG